MRLSATPIAPAPSPPLDWAEVKAKILARLDVAAEFESLGVIFAKAANSKGIRECHAVGREDANPSAFVNVTTGVYHDSGGEGTTLHLFDAAMKWGEHGRWIDVVKHYADRAGVEIGRVQPGTGGRIRESISLYRDAFGEVQYAVFRYRLPNGKKSFSQHPPDGKGGWKFGTGCMDGVRPLPYRLPEILASDAENDPVWIVEGEKDADRLASLGLVATTNHQGAQSTDATWPHFLRYFEGRECYVLPDNDPGGKAHADRVATHLTAVARVVKVVPLPGLHIKGDVSDWLDLGHDLNELGQLASRAPAWSPTEHPATETDLSRDVTVTDIRRLLATQSWVWPGWIPSAALTLLAAEGGTGKTRFVFDLHRRLVGGLPWPDGAIHGYGADAKVLWVAADNQWHELCDMTDPFGIPGDNVVFNSRLADPFDGTSLQTEEELADLESRILRVRPAFVVIDTITNTSDAKVQDAAEVKRQYKPLQEIALRTQTAILCVTHLNAAGKVLGRRAVEKVRVVIQMDYPDPEGQPFRRKLWVSKSKAVRPSALGVTMGDQGNDYDTSPPEPPSETAKPAKGRAPIPEKELEAAEWLRSVLTLRGKTRVSVVRRDSEEEEIAAATLYRAKGRLGVVETTEDGFKFWALPHANVDGASTRVPF